MLLDFDDASVRVSREAVHQALCLRRGGALRREVAACLRTGHSLRVPSARSGGRGKDFVDGEVKKRAAG